MQLWVGKVVGKNLWDYVRSQGNRQLFLHQNYHKTYGVMNCLV